MNPLRVIFYGTASNAVPPLSALAHDARFQIVGVVTQPDRPAGRKQTLESSPVKEKALELCLPIFQFESVKNEEASAALKALKADVALVASFGQIIPQAVLDLTPHGAINIHPSLLPKFRGATPIPGAIKAGETITGVTMIKMDALMDHGPILASVTEPIQTTDTTVTLMARLAQMAADILPDILYKYIQGEIKPQEQDHAHASIVKLLSRENGLLDWNKGADELERTVRAYDPWPGTYMMLEGKRLKILSAVIGPRMDFVPSSRFLTENGQPAIMTGNENSLILTRVQPEGKSPMDGKTFVNGYRNWSFFPTDGLNLAQ